MMQFAEVFADLGIVTPLVSQFSQFLCPIQGESAGKWHLPIDLRFELY
jgi:hypothetical protein